MSVIIKTPEQIEKIRIASQIAAEVLEMIEPHIQVGVSTGEIDKICQDYIEKTKQAISATIGYHGYQHATCISINDVICHGIPSFDKKLKNGDILNIDVTVIKNGYFGDTSRMYFAGTPSIQGQRLCKITQESLYLAIKMVKPGIRLRTLGKAIQDFVESHGFSTVRDYCGHGVGVHFHEAPQVLHYDADDGGLILQPGMTFTIEPMINVGNYRTRLMGDGWTVKTKDRSLSAQYEHTLAVTENGCEIMTLRKEESIPRIITHS